MYQIDSISGEDLEKKAKESPPFGPGFTEIPKGTARMEIWGTSFSDSGPDFTEFRLVTQSGEILASKRVDGY